MSKYKTAPEENITPTLKPVTQIPGVTTPDLDAAVSIRGATGGGGGGHVIQDEGTPLEQRANLNIIGDNVVVTDDELNDATKITISSQNEYGRDSNGYFKLPVGTNMYG